jgi:N-hydroxyarylamine O-acetyltransferase
VNSLFAMALAAVGFDYYLVGARPMFYQDRRAKTHMVVIVRLAGDEYLCDLGFGSFGIRAPIALSNINTPITQDYDQFMLRCDDACLYVLQAWIGGAWVSQFGFDLYPHELVDFVPANFFNSKSPEAIFVQKLLVVKHTVTGRKILLGTSLKTYEKGQCEIRELEASEVAGVLKVEFDLDIH